MAKNKFDILRGKRVGLITNPTGVDRMLHSDIDLIFNAPGVSLAALYGPEHGVRGEYAAGDMVESTNDAVTGLTVYSLYGTNRKPSPEMLKGIDVLIYDIQDIGSRSYTFISTLGLAMEAAAENGIPFIVLDRPNPLGGLRMEGPIIEVGFSSFVGQYPIPYIYGLTAGELAMFINNEGLLKNGIKCNLQVIRMEGWKREMLYEDTGLPWVPSSPHIPESFTCHYYPATGILGELYTLNIGVGYTLPFRMVAAEWINADSLAVNLNALRLPGILFRPVHYKPYYSVLQGKMVHGVQIYFTDKRRAPLTLVQFYILQEIHKLRPSKDIFSMCEKSRLEMFDKVCGTDKVRIKFSSAYTTDSILDIWNSQIPAFREKVRKYLLY
jgi:uncharacterized protein YbbC (DUF1343 family)